MKVSPTTLKMGLSGSFTSPKLRAGGDREKCRRSDP